MLQQKQLQILCKTYFKTIKIVKLLLNFNRVVLTKVITFDRILNYVKVKDEQNIKTRYNISKYTAIILFIRALQNVKREE